MIKILITGANSYVGMSFEKYIRQHYPNVYEVDTIDMVDGSWKEKSFAGYDAIYHVAGIAHSDFGNIPKEKEMLYKTVNTDLTIDVAKKAKIDGVRQFVFMSSSIVYGESAKIGKKKNITLDTVPTPANCYGNSKLQAELGIASLRADNFKVCILRCPMIYGKGCKGNFPQLEKFAKRLKFFPYIENERSMLYVGNLVEFVRLMIVNEEDGIFWPQNKDYSNTSNLVKTIALANGRRMRVVKGFGWFLRFLGLFTKKVNKAFGNFTYDKKISKYKEDYCLFDLNQSIYLTENADD